MISDIYLREIDQRFAPVVGAVIARADLSTDKDVLDLGTGTGAVAEWAAVAVRSNGRVVDVDISPEMLALARKRARLTHHDSLLLQLVDEKIKRMLGAASVRPGWPA